MFARFLLRYTIAATLLCSGSSQAIQIRTYSSADHDRFTGFPSSPALNPGFIYDADRYTGIGWRADATQWQFAMISRSHLLFAAHAAPPIGAAINFVSTNGTLVSRNISTRTVVDNDDGTDSDLILLQLDSPIEEDEGISPFPYFDYSSYSSYLGKDAVVFGKTVRAGSGNYDGFSNVSGSGLNPTFMVSYDYDASGSGDDDAKLESGDSGSPQFLDINGVLGLVAINAAIDINGDIQTNFASFVPDYVSEINTMLAPRGYRMTPARASNTNVSESTSVLTTTPRQGNPLTITVDLQNTGFFVTGNLEAEFHFAPGEAPDSIAGSGWIDYGGGNDWTVRSSELSPLSSTTITLSWSAAPLVDTLVWTLDSRSDKASDGFLSSSIPLPESYNSWADGLALGGHTDDPDLDALLNLHEYAFGSDADDPVNAFSSGEPARPVVMMVGEDASISFPERSDKTARGLSYIPEWSDDLSAASWSATPPASLVSSSAPYDPAIPGFVKRTLSWSIEDSRHFLRIGVQLEE